MSSLEIRDGIQFLACLPGRGYKTQLAQGREFSVGVRAMTVPGVYDALAVFITLGALRGTIARSGRTGVRLRVRTVRGQSLLMSDKSALDSNERTGV